MRYLNIKCPVRGGTVLNKTATHYPDKWLSNNPVKQKNLLFFDMPPTRVNKEPAHNLCTYLPKIIRSLSGTIICGDRFPIKKRSDLIFIKSLFHVKMETDPLHDNRSHL